MAKYCRGHSLDFSATQFSQVQRTFEGTLPWEVLGK